MAIMLILSLKTKYSIFQIGDERELTFEDTYRFAGKLSMRKSAAILSQANTQVPIVCLYVANGLDIPSTVIFGGSRPVIASLLENTNIDYTPECSPCWIHHDESNTMFTA